MSTFQKFKNNTNRPRTVSKYVVKSMIQARMEPKALTISTVGNTATAGAIHYISAIGQDDTVSGRTGVQIRPKTFNCRISVFGAGNFVTRFILVQDRLNVGSSPTVTDILTSADVAAQYNVTSQLNKRFKILNDTALCLSNTGEQQRYKVLNIPMKGIIGYVGTGTTSASGGTNSVFLLIIGDSATPAFNIKSQIHYTDA